MPDEFKGDRTKLKSFLTQCELFIGFNSAQFSNDSEKVLQVVTLLRGAALDQVEPFLEDFIKTQNDHGGPSRNTDETAAELFRSIKGFKEGIKKVFGDLDKDRTAERFL